MDVIGLGRLVDFNDKLLTGAENITSGAINTATGVVNTTSKIATDPFAFLSDGLGGLVDNLIPDIDWDKVMLIGGGCLVAYIVVSKI